jgi:hypothetical protein
VCVSSDQCKLVSELLCCAAVVDIASTMVVHSDVLYCRSISTGSAQVLRERCSATVTATASALLLVSLLPVLIPARKISEI